MDSSLIRVRFASRHGWTVARDGVEFPISIHSAQWSAERSGRALAQREYGRLVVHNVSGDIIRIDSFLRA